SPGSLTTSTGTATATAAAPPATAVVPPAARGGTAVLTRPVQPSRALGPPMVPPGPPAWMGVPLARRAGGWVVLGAIGVGVLGDLTLRAEVAGVITAVAIAATAALLLVSGLLVTRQSRVLVALAPVFGVWMAVRESDWLVPLDLIAAAGLLLLGTSLARGGSVADLPFAGLMSRAWHAFLHGCAAPELLVRAVPDAPRLRSARAVAVLRGALLAAPVLILLGVLLVSGDAVFASFFDVDLDLDVADVIGHVFLTGLATWVCLWLLRVAGAEPPEPLPRVSARLGAVEATVVLGSVVALFGAFAVSQAVAVIGGDDYVRRTTGLTYAEYARSGFFQLLWVAALTVATLLLLRACVARDAAPRRFAVLFGAVCALTLLIVAVAIRRLGLYQETFGLTMLRLYCTLFAVWIGVVLVLLAAWLVRPWARAWFPAAAAGAGLALLLGLNVVNPEALVAATNLQREAALRTDTGYVAELSEDAIPTIVELLPTLDEEERAALVRRICRGTARDDDRSWMTWTLSHSRTEAARAEACG
ncbi:MAG TPA: DUF4173 domain-containing protein, partial [Pseudonocardiaceae bacterium]